MKTMLIRVLACTLASTVIGLAWSVTTQCGEWEITGQVRPRAEGRYGYRDLPRRPWNPIFLITQRSRVGVRYKADEKAALYVQLQDVRTWGDETNTLNDPSADYLDVHQAYVNLVPVSDLTLRIGRQEIVYDEERVLGNVDWVQQGRSHDAIRLIWGDSAFAFHGAWAHHENDDPNFLIPFPPYVNPRTYGNYINPDNYQDLAFVRLERARGALSGAVMLLYDSYDPLLLPHTYGVAKDRWTPGVYALVKRGKTEARAEGYYQFGLWKTYLKGDPGDAERYDINAFMIGLRASHSFDPATFTLWFDYLSGDDNIFAGDYSVFNTLYGTNHKFYGFADHFTNIPADTKGLGLQDLALKTKIANLGPTTTQIDLHYFWFAKEDAKRDRALGFEGDLMCSLPVTKNVALTGGYTFIAPTDAWKRLQDGTRPGHWAWMMLDFNVK